MAKIEYGVLLVAVAALSFTLGSSFGSTAAPPTTPVVAAVIDAGRFAALEHRVDALASERPNPVIASMTTVERQAVDATMPALTDAVATLREAVMALNRTQSAGILPPRTLRPSNVSALQGILANAPKEGEIEGSDLLMLTIPQVLDRLGQPTKAERIDTDSMSLIFRCNTGDLWLRIKDGMVIAAYASPHRP